MTRAEARLLPMRQVLALEPLQIRLAVTRAFSLATLGRWADREDRRTVYTFFNRLHTRQGRGRP